MAVNFNADQFRSEILEGKKTALVDFYADWCGSCKMIAPMIDQLAEELSGQALVVKIDADTQGEIAEQYDAMTLPTIIASKDGKEVVRHVCPAPKKALAALLD